VLKICLQQVNSSDFGPFEMAFISIRLSLTWITGSLAGLGSDKFGPTSLTPLFNAKTAQTPQSQNWSSEVRQPWTCKGKIIRLNRHGICWDIRNRMNTRREHGFVHINISIFSLMIPIDCINDVVSLMSLMTSLMKAPTNDCSINDTPPLMTH